MRVLSNHAMKATGFAFSLGLAGMSGSLLAGGGGDCHFHGSAPAKEETVTMCAAKRKAALIDKGKIDASWKDVQQISIEQVDGKKGKEWKVSFKNAAASDKTKETLYMFFAANGNFIASNFSGK